jgi:hypothetical protein
VVVRAFGSLLFDRLRVVLAAIHLAACAATGILSSSKSGGNGERSHD